MSSTYCVNPPDVICETYCNRCKKNTKQTYNVYDKREGKAVYRCLDCNHESGPGVKYESEVSETETELDVEEYWRQLKNSQGQ